MSKNNHRIGRSRGVGHRLDGMVNRPPPGRSQARFELGDHLFDRVRSAGRAPVASGPPARPLNRLLDSGSLVTRRVGFYEAPGLIRAGAIADVGFTGRWRSRRRANRSVRQPDRWAGRHAVRGRGGVVANAAPARPPRRNSVSRRPSLASAIHGDGGDDSAEASRAHSDIGFAGRVEFSRTVAPRAAALAGGWLVCARIRKGERRTESARPAVTGESISRLRPSGPKRRARPSSRPEHRPSQSTGTRPTRTSRSRPGRHTC